MVAGESRSTRSPGDLLKEGSFQRFARRKIVEEGFTDDPWKSPKGGDLERSPCRGNRRVRSAGFSPIEVIENLHDHPVIRDHGHESQCSVEGR